MMQAVMDRVEFRVATRSGTTFHVRKTLSLDPVAPFARLGQSGSRGRTAP